MWPRKLPPRIVSFESETPVSQTENVDSNSIVFTKDSFVLTKDRGLTLFKLQENVCESTETVSIFVYVQDLIDQTEYVTHHCICGHHYWDMWNISSGGRYSSNYTGCRLLIFLNMPQMYLRLLTLDHHLRAFQRESLMKITSSIELWLVLPTEANAICLN